jgi:hypothetical protein
MQTIMNPGCDERDEWPAGPGAIALVAVVGREPVPNRIVWRQCLSWLDYADAGFGTIRWCEIDRGFSSGGGMSTSLSH